MSPLEIFRRNQKVTMTFLILLAMFAFVVLPTVSEYMRRSGPGMVDPVVAEFSGYSLTASRVETFTRKHYSTVQYLRKLAEETMRRGGTPQVPGFALDQRSGQIQSVGINGSPSPDMSIRTMQFAAQAEKQGFELDDTAIELWLEQYTNGTMSEREMFTLLRRETNNQMGQYQLFDMLRKQLLSALYFRGANVGVAQGQFPLQSPLDHWKNFLKLNQKATVNAYGVLVNDYIDQTDANPSESDVVAMYEAGKDRYPSEQSAEPGFRRRDTAAFEYLMAELQRFRDAEVAKLSEAEIKAEYENRIAGGAFQLPPEMNLETAEDAEPESDSEPESAEVSEEMKDQPEESAATQDDAPPEDAQMKKDSAAEGESSDDESPESDPADAEKSAASEQDVEEQQKQQVEEFAEELEEAGDLDGAEADEEAASDENQSAIDADDNGVRLVVLQADVPTETTDDNESAEAATESDTESDGNPAASDNDEAENDEAETTDGSEPTSEAAAEEAEPRYRPFEEVREQIAQSMVEDDARRALDQAVSKARSVMRKYSRARAIHETSGDTEKPAPKRPDLKSLAEELGLTYRDIGMHNPVSLADEPIASSFEEGTELSQRGVPFTAMMFGVEGQVIKQDVFTPAVSVDIESQRTYLTWKTDEKAAYTPELNEVRDEVVQAIRVKQARELAKQAAEVMAEKANSGESLETLVPEDRQDEYVKGIGPFSWLNMLGFGSVTIGNVPELDSVDEDFMEAVFGSESGQCVVAANGPERVYYVVKRTSLLPMTKDLRSIFSQQSERFMAMFMTDGTAAKVQEGFFDTIDEQTGFEQFEMQQ